MNIDNFCNLGAALQNKQVEIGKQPQIYFFRDEDTLEEMLASGYFNILNKRVEKGDLILLYSTSEKAALWVRVASNNGGIVSIEEISTQDTYTKSQIDELFVSKIIDEKIAGKKTFIGNSATNPSGSTQFIIGNEKDIKNSTPSTTRVSQIFFNDKNGLTSASIEYVHDIDKSTYIEATVKKQGSSEENTLTFGFDEDGNKFSEISTPTEDTLNSSQIDTVGARNTKLLNYQDKETALNYNNITNCITYIPQDIKLELNNGTLTLKAGSKVYVPNGAGVFDVVNVSSDITLAKNSTGLYFVFMKSHGVESDTMPFSYCYSGNSQPNITHTYAIWYDTANNKIKWTKNNGSTWVDGYSLPICIVVNDTPGTQNVSSIGQVFNGFGYIGHHAYKLPNVKGLVAYGRNTDGTLKSFTVGSSNIQLYELPSNRDDTYMYISRANTFIMGSKVSDGYPKYDVNKNWCYCNSSSTDSYLPVVKFATNSSNQVTLFEIKTPFHAVDYNDTEYIGHQAMPSDRSVTLTLPASGQTLTAQADGEFYFQGTLTSIGEKFRFENNTTTLQSQARAVTASEYNVCSIRCSKGDVVKVLYDSTISDAVLKFIYTNGSK